MCLHASWPPSLLEYLVGHCGKADAGQGVSSGGGDGVSLCYNVPILRFVNSNVDRKLRNNLRFPNDGMAKEKEGLLCESLPFSYGEIVVLHLSHIMRQRCSFSVASALWASLF